LKAKASQAKPKAPVPLPILAAPTKLEVELASRVISRKRLLPFVQRLNDRYMAGWVHKDICRRLEKFSDDVAAGKSPRLMLLMPPRSGKSELCSRAFPAWHLGRQPDHEIIACSYNVSLAMGFSKKVKEVIDDPSFVPVFDIKLDPNDKSAEEWSLHSSRGAYVAAGVGGGITGKGAHVLIIDDPLKNAEEADSADTREKLWDWYGSTAYTRLAPGGGVLVVQTWWHDDDLAGRLQVAMDADPEADQFVVVKYPAISETDEYLDYDTDMIVAEEPANGTLLRLKGEALHPERYDLQKLQQIKRTISPRFWSALYQQNPVPDDGAYFTKDTFRRSGLPNRAQCNVIIAWDFAISEKKQNDYTVGTVLLHDSNDMLHVAEQLRFKSGDAFFIVEAILNLAAKWYSPNMVVGFEDGQIYRAIAALLNKRMKERRIYPAITVLPAITDKMARARPLQGRMQQGMVSFSAEGEWYDTCRLEMLRFPAGAHDDCVDSLSWAVQMAIGRSAPRPPAEKPIKSWRDRLNHTGHGSHMSA
jgi:predicted phage terminase large subunit-like protein